MRLSASDFVRVRLTSSECVRVRLSASECIACRYLSRSSPRSGGSSHADCHPHCMQVPLEILASQWWLSLYANVLPTPTLLRMWDVLLAGGGVDTLVASSLSLLRRFEPRLKETEVS